MPEEAKIIEKIKELRNTASKEKFLADFRLELVAYVSANPAKSGSHNFWNIRWLHIPYSRPPAYGKLGHFQQAAGTALFVVFLGASGAAIASQKSLPGHTLYPVKILTEDLRSSFAIWPEEKAKLQAEFASRRVAEVKIMLEENGLEAPGLEEALNRLEQNASSTMTIIDQEKQKGTDVSSLAKSLNDDLDKNKEILDELLKSQKDSLKKQERQIRMQLVTVQQTGDAKQAESLTKQLNDLINQKQAMEANLSASKNMLKGKLTGIANHMSESEKKAGAKKNAEHAIQEAKNAAAKKQELLAETAQKQNAKAVTDALAEFDTLLKNANQSFQNGNYSKAEKYAEDAVEKFEDAEKIIEENYNSEQTKEIKGAHAQSDKETDKNAAASPSPSGELKKK